MNELIELEKMVENILSEREVKNFPDLLEEIDFNIREALLLIENEFGKEYYMKVLKGIGVEVANLTAQKSVQNIDVMGNTNGFFKIMKILKIVEDEEFRQQLILSSLNGFLYGVYFSNKKINGDMNGKDHQEHR